MKCIVSFVIVALIASFNQICFTQEIQGYIKTSDGKPISQVSVNNKKSDSEGFYKTEISKWLKTDTKGIVYFEKHGFIPKAVSVELSTDNLDIVLEMNVPSERLKIPNCKGLNTQKRIGNIFKVIVPKGAKKKTGHDIDYGYYYISYGKNKKIWLDAMEYYTGSGKFPQNRFITESREIKIKVWESENEIVGYDWRGRTFEGKYWRWFGFDYWGGNSIKYTADTQEIADYFDKVVDNGCIQVPE